MLHPTHHATNVDTYSHRTFNPQATPSQAAPSATPPVDPMICWQLWEVRQAHFYKLCLRWLNHNQADADDAFNTAALAVWRKTQTEMPVIVNPMGWLTGLVRHACLDLQRKRQQEANQTVEIDAFDTEAWADAPAAPAVYHSPEAFFLQREQYVYLHEKIAALPVRLRIPFTLRCCEELTYEAISAQLGLAAPTVRKRVQEARTLLDRQLRKYLRGQTGPDLHAPWPDEQRLFSAPRPAAPTDGDGETAARQPRVTPLAQVSKREEQKLRTLRAYVQGYPTGWKKRLDLADQLCKMGQPAEAVVVYEQVLAKQPHLLSVWVQVGRLYAELQHGEAAVAAYKRALSLASTNALRAAIVALLEGVAVGGA